MSAHLAGRTFDQRAEHLRPFVIDAIDPALTAEQRTAGREHILACDSELGLKMLIGYLTSAHALLAEVGVLNVAAVLAKLRTLPIPPLGASS